jgi:hypothetical protein
LKILDKEKGIYALDSDKGIFVQKNIVLMELGKVLERSITMEKEVFKRTLLKLDHPDQEGSCDSRLEMVILDNSGSGRPPPIHEVEQRHLFEGVNRLRGLRQTNRGTIRF